MGDDLRTIRRLAVGWTIAAVVVLIAAMVAVGLWVRAYSAEPTCDDLRDNYMYRYRCASE